MASNLTIPSTHDIASWVDTIKLIDTDEPVVGGIDGVSNAQAIQFSQRSQWLREVITRVVDVAGVDAGSGNLDQLLDAISTLIASGIPADVLRRTVSTPDLTAGYYVTPAVLDIVDGTVTPDFVARNVMTLSVTEAITLANPATIPAGGRALIIATQDATGRALTLGSVYRIAGGAWSAEPGDVNFLDLTFGAGGALIDVDISQRGEA